MTTEKYFQHDFTSEFVFQMSRSSGPGGQNVNKVNTRVELRFDVTSSGLLTEEEKLKIITRLATRINKNGVLILASQSERSMVGNKEKVIERFHDLLKKALRPEKKRKKTQPTHASRVRRLNNKRELAEKKSRRRLIE
jgi:ribosome-associated protein